MTATRSFFILGHEFVLTLHPIEEPPANKMDEVALVVLPGSTALKAGMWRGGKWCNEKRKPYDPQPVCWYSMGGNDDPTA
jgi:hypothetical protein